MNTEAVLLVDDDQSQPGKTDLALKQGVGADDQRRLARGNPGQCGLPFFTLYPATQPGPRDRQRLKPGGEILPVLLRQNFSGRHDCHLVAIGDGLQRRRRCNQGFARAYIALQQPQHRPRLFQVGRDFADHALLGSGRRERQLRQEALHYRLVWRQLRGRSRLVTFPQSLQ